MGDTQERDLVAQLQRRADMIADAHARKSGKKVERPFTLEDCAIAEISRLRSELAMWHSKVGEFAKAFEAQRSELERARADLERAYEKDDVKTREINILTRENRNLYERLASSPPASAAAPAPEAAE